MVAIDAQRASHSKAVHVHARVAASLLASSLPLGQQHGIRCWHQQRAVAAWCGSRGSSAVIQIMQDGTAAEMLHIRNTNGKSWGRDAA